MQRIGALCVLVVVVSVLFVASSALAIVPLTKCEQKCQDEYTDAAIACAKIGDEGARRACDAAAYAKYTACRGGCPQQEKADLQDCYQDCEYTKGRADEACSRKRDPTKRADCYAKAETEYGDCRRTCEKKWKDK